MKYPSWPGSWCIPLVAAAALIGCAKPGTNAPGASPASAAAGAAQPSFATPEEASEALVAALEKDDRAALQSLLGLGTEQLLTSGDPVQERQERNAFLAEYRAQHTLSAGGADHLVLLVGADQWPLPMPLVRKDGRWRFDGAAGADELVLRRIGANELNTIDVMHGFVAAQEDYAATGHDGQKPGVYARQLRSSPGKQDGLYWEVAAGEAPSPAGPLLASAAAEGYANTGAQRAHAPYHGYLYRMLTSQGAAASGGAQDYLADGKLTGGVALLAYPATYGASGIMTFIVNQDGVVWQRDLGTDTAQAAAAIRQFNPDDSWTPLAPEG
jgi:hypothetical protein